MDSLGVLTSLVHRQGLPDLGSLEWYLLARGAAFAMADSGHEALLRDGVRLRLFPGVVNRGVVVSPAWFMFTCVQPKSFAQSYRSRVLQPDDTLVVHRLRGSGAVVSGAIEARMERDMTDYANARVKAVLDSAAIASFEPKDWLDLARAALDQAGLSLADQRRVETLLPKADELASKA